METAAALRSSLEFSHNMMEGTIADCAPETLHKTLPEATIGAIAGIYAHVVFSEDRQIQAMLQGKPTVFQSDGWDQKLSVKMPEGRADLAWRSTQNMDLESFRAYAQAVYAASDAYLSSVPADELDRKFEAFGREHSVGSFLSTIVVTHAPLHCGEIAALKGVQGHKGLPF